MQQAIWAEWRDGGKEKIDSAESEEEALYLVKEYNTAFGKSVKRIWIKLESTESVSNDQQADRRS